MAGYLTTDQIFSVTGAQGTLFDTMKREIVVFKQPKRVVTPANVNVQNNYFGYKSENVFNSQVESYEPVSGIFNAQISYKDKQESLELPDINSYTYEGDVRIKVENDCYEYIQKGKTENIQFDGKIFNVVGEARVKNFLGRKMYVYHLKYSN